MSLTEYCGVYLHCIIHWRRICIRMYIAIGMCAIVAALLAGKIARSDEEALGIKSTSEAAVPLTPLDPAQPADPGLTEKLAAAMDDFHASADLLNDQHSAQTPQLYHKMTEALEDILDLLDNADAAYYFLSAHGFDTIVAPHLEIDNTPLRSLLLQLTKALFDVAPTTTRAVIPSRILEQLIEIFERDDNSDVKAQVVELLSDWLPENPRAQARVMKLKGLEPFYAQLSKLETPAIGSILELFSKIIREHEAARVSRVQKSKADYVALRLYQQIGLIERIETPLVCNGLLNVFVEMWAVGKAERALLVPVLGLLRAVRPHCAAVFRGREQALTLLAQMAKFVRNPVNKEYFDELNVNTVELTEFFNDFIEQVTVVQREEL